MFGPSWRGNEFERLRSGMLVVSSTFNSGSLKVGKGCIGTGREYFKLK